MAERPGDQVISNGKTGGLTVDLVIGVDGGSTKTQLAVAGTDGVLQGLYEAGGTWYKLENALDELIALFQPIRNRQVRLGVFTVAGWDFPADQQAQRALIEKALAFLHIVVEESVYENDVFATLKSAQTIGEICVVVSCGTGMIGLAAEKGTFFRTPGFDYLSGEWGSGIHQAEFGIHLACASLLGREEPFPILISKAFSYFNAHDLNSLTDQVVNHFTSNRQRGYFLQAIYEAYHEGCPGAARVINRAADELARTVFSLLKKVKGYKVPVVFGGGVIRQFGLPPGFSSRLYDLCGKQPELYLIDNPPVYGALHWALSLAQLPVMEVTALLNCRKIEE